MPVKQNTEYADRRRTKTGSARPEANNGIKHERAQAENGFSRGNKNWNTGSYKQSVHTERTDTRVLNASNKGRKSYYYDNTPSAIKARQKKAREERLRKWKTEMKRNKRHRKAMRIAISALVMLLSVTLLFGTVYKLFFITNNIKISGNTSYSGEQIVEASGLTSKTNLFSFSSRVAAQKIIFSCPKISEAVFDRTAPNIVSIALTEESPKFYLELYGEVYSLTGTLRVIERTDIESAKSEGLARLKLQGVSKAVSGSKIVLVSDRAERYLASTLEALSSSSLYERLSCIDLTDDFDTVVELDEKYRLDFGTQDDFDIKIKLAAEVLNDSIFKSDNKALVDLTDISQTSVIIDNQLVFN